MSFTNYNKKIEDYTGKIITKEIPATFYEEVNFQWFKIEVLADFFEQLLLFDKISISLGLSPAPIAFLIDELGIDLFEKCVQEGIFEFVIWTPQFMTIAGSTVSKDEDHYLGIPPIVSSYITSPEKIEPKAILEESFKFVSTYTPSFRKNSIINNSQRAFLKVDPQLTNGIKELIISCYTTHKLEKLGLPYKKHPNSLDYQERAILLALAQDILETLFLVEQGYSSMNNYNSFVLAKTTFDQMTRSAIISQSADEILKIEKIPSFRNIYKNQLLDFNTAIKLRLTRSGKEFRDFLNSSSSDNTSLIADYLNFVKSYSDRKTFFESDKSKFTRSVTMTAAGSLFSSGPVGFIAGVALGLFDTFILEKLLNGSRPKLFLDLVKENLFFDSYQEPRNQPILK